MKTSNKVLIAIIFLAILPSIVILALAIANTRQTIKQITNINTYNINVVDARGANITLARDDSAHAEMGVVWIRSKLSDKEPVVKIVGDTLVIGKEVDRICIPNAKTLILPDSVVENPFFSKGKDQYAVYVGYHE